MLYFEQITVIMYKSVKLHNGIGYTQADSCVSFDMTYLDQQARVDLTSSVSALGAARLGRCFQRSFSGVGGVRVHVW